MRQLLLAAATMIALTFTSAPPALAGPPAPVEPQRFDLLAGDACAGFGLRLEQSGGNLHVKTIASQNGKPVKVIQAGKGFLLTYTNLVTGKSVSISTNGSVSKTTTNPNGTKTVSLTGHNGLILFPTDVPAGPSTTQYIGRVVYNVDAKGNFTLVSTTGQKRDICAELAR